MRWRSKILASALLAACGAIPVAATETAIESSMLYCMAFLSPPGERPANVQSLAVFFPNGTKGSLAGLEVFDPHFLLGGKTPDLVLPNKDGWALLTSTTPVSQIYLRSNAAASGYDALIGSGGRSPEKAMCKELGSALALHLRGQFRANPLAVDNPK